MIADICDVEMVSQLNLLKMKKLTFCILATFFMLSIAPNHSNGATDENSNTVTTSRISEPTNPNSQLNRLNEIKAMDMSTLNRTEKKELRKEARSIKEDQYGQGRRHDNGRHGGDYDGRRSGGSIYFVGGSGLLIVLLIILLI